jgi:hypothetical protein
VKPQEFKPQRVAEIIAEDRREKPEFSLCGSLRLLSDSLRFKFFLHNPWINDIESFYK